MLKKFFETFEISMFNKYITNNYFVGNCEDAIRSYLAANDKMPQVGDAQFYEQKPSILDPHPPTAAPQQPGEIADELQ
jgi:hypothetical protein